MIAKLPNIPLRIQQQNNKQNYSTSPQTDFVSFSAHVLKLKSPSETLELATIRLLRRVTQVLDQIKAGQEGYLFCDATKLSNEAYKTSSEPLTQIITKATKRTPADFTLFYQGKAYDIYLPVRKKLGRIELHIGAVQRNPASSLNQEVQGIIKQLMDKLTIKKES